MLTEFGRHMRARVDQCSDEVQDVLPRWTDDQRRAVQQVLTVHLLAMHGHGMKDAARLVRLDTDLSMLDRNRVADAILQVLLDRREWI